MVLHDYPHMRNYLWWLLISYVIIHVPVLSRATIQGPMIVRR